MARATNGWVKLHRKILDNPILANDFIALGLFSKLLLYVNWQEDKTLFGTEVIDCKPGEVVTGLKKLGGATSVSVVDRKLKLFVRFGFIDMVTTPRGRFIKILNWERYQSDTDEGESSEKEVSKNRERTEKTRRKLGENSEKLIKKIKNIKKYIPTEFDFSLAQDWMQFATSVHPNGKYDLEQFATSICEAKTKTNLTDAQMRELLEFVSKDKFWRSNAISPAQLLKVSKTNGLRKIDNIILAAKKVSPSALKVRSTKEISEEELREKLRYVACTWCRKRGVYTDVDGVTGSCGSCESAKIRGITLPVHPMTIRREKDKGVAPNV